MRFEGAAPGGAGVVADVAELRRTGVGAVLTVAARRRAEPVFERDGVVEFEAVEVGSPADRARRDEAVAALRAYLGALAEFGEGADVLVEVPDDPVAASYRLTSLARVSEPERQELLDQPATAERLGRIAGLFERERRLLVATMGARGRHGGHR